MLSWCDQPHPLPRARTFSQPDHYIAFGISGSDSRVQMVGGDVTWTWLDDEGVHAEDLDLTAYEQVGRRTLHL